MAPPQTNPKVDAAILRAGDWREAFEALRALILSFGLTEELKWGQPCYSFEGANVVLIHGFKDYCALLFMKGALLKDPNGLLVQQTPNVQSARQIRFTNAAEIRQLEPALRDYLKDALQVAKTGARVVRKATADFPVPEELQARLEQDPALAAAFKALTPGRQRGYLLHFAAAKQAKTRAARVEKWTPQILAGKGLED
jgi:uncharacterized protein YdeI (YjbR/CyaY-like superfamily)